ncbi:MAG: response regulator transcription factor [Bacteroidetes bacterium]|uniref:Response regulator transcription factor n=1 Tax=Candidatus Merdivivens pullistercoris TaxID=2840873 RepID=A0A9D9I372_9BACT|nr:response regulator transcription factor [Candidatus Merdivivens pullistercoris]
MQDDGKIKLLLVEDERLLAEIISDTLSEKGFSVKTVHNGAEALETAVSIHPDIIVTDIMMPAMDGFTFVERLRLTDRHTPVLFISALGDVENVVKGLELGGGDYIRKPFAMAELIARIHSLLNRRSANWISENEFVLGQYIFDIRNGRLVKDGKETLLTQRETEILEILCGNIGNYTPNSTFLDKLWGNENYFTTRSLNVHISNLRKKLSSDPSVLVTSARGLGYKLQIL